MNTILRVLFIFLVFNIEVCFSQIPPVKKSALDSLTEQVLLSRNIDIDKYIVNIKEVIQVAIDEQNDYYQSIGWTEYAFYHIIKSNYDSALVLLDHAQTLLEPFDEDSIILTINIFKGLSETGLFEYFDAIQTYNNVIPLAKRLNDGENFLAANQMIGDIYYRCKEYETALEYFRKSIPNDTTLNSVERHAWWNLNIGGTYAELNLFKNALQHYNKALRIFENTNMVRGLGYTHNSLGELLALQNDTSCILHFQKAIENNNHMKNYEQIIISHMGLGNYYARHPSLKTLAAEQYNKALELGLASNLEYLTIPAIDFHIENSNRNTSISIVDLLKTRVRASEVASKKSSTVDLKVVEAMDKLALSEANALQSQERNVWFKKMIGLLAAFAISILAVLFLINKKNKRLKASRQKIDSQYQLIKKQSEVLEQINEELSVNVNTLGNELEINTLALSHIKSLVKSISDSNENKEIATKLRSEMKDEYWDELKFLNNFRDQDFILSLTTLYPNLTSKEITLSCMVRMGLSSKEIAQITYRSVGSIKVARSRLRKKLRLDTTVGLVAYLNGL